MRVLPYCNSLNERTEAQFVTLLPFAGRRLCILFVPVTLLVPFAAAGAQNGQAQTTVPGLDDYTLPAQPVRPTPLQTPEPRIAPLPRPTPGATPTPVALPTPAALAPPPVRPTVRPAAKPTPVPTPEALPTAPVAPHPAPAAAPVALPSPTPSPSPAPVTTPSAPTRAAQPSHALAWWAAGIALAAVIAGTLLYRRRRLDEAEDVAPLAPPPVAVEPRPVAPADPAPVEPVAAPRPQVEIDLEVKRAGTNLLSAAIEYRVILRNAGSVDARGVTLDLRLFGVDPGLEAALAALFDAPIDRPAVARFDLVAGSTAALEGTAMLPRGIMPPLPLQGVEAGGGRVLFVPVMTVNLHYGWDGGVGQSAASFVIGIDRGADAKLGPFRLDGPPRMHDRVRLLPFTVSRSR
jgi:hypothetical protein